MTSFALVTALVLRIQSPAEEVRPAAAAPELRDPFAAKAEVERPAPIRVHLPSELVDPFSNPAPVRALPRPSRTVPADLVDPFAKRRARAEDVPSRLGDPFSAKPAAQPGAGSPDLSDPFAR